MINMKNLKKEDCLKVEKKYEEEGEAPLLVDGNTEIEWEEEKLNNDKLDKNVAG